MVSFLGTFSSSFFLAYFFFPGWLAVCWPLEVMMGLFLFVTLDYSRYARAQEERSQVKMLDFDEGN